MTGLLVITFSGGSKCKGGNPAMAPIQSDRLVINFEFDIRPIQRLVTIRKNAYTVVNLLSGKLVKLVPPDVRF